MAPKPKVEKKFYEVGGYSGVTAQADNGFKLMNSLFKMMDMRSQIDEKYAKELEAFSLTQRKAFEKIYENSHTKNAINEMILEANCTAQIHREARKRVNEQCLEKIKSFRAETWNKKFFGGTVQKDQYEKAFKTAQQSWATLDKEYKSNKSSYDKSCQAVISQKQAVDNLQMTNDPKLPKAQEAMAGKENARNNCRTKYEETIRKMDEVKESYIGAMNAEFTTYSEFEHKRLDFTREILQSFRDISQATHSDQMTVTIKGLQKDGSDDLNEINVNQKLKKIEQTIQSYDTATAVNVFNNEKGPNNATNMEWPSFKEYDPDAEAMAHKMANHNGSSEVATNEIQDGSFKPIEEQPATDYNSYPPNPAYEQAETWSNDGDTPAYEPEPVPEPEPEPVQMNGSGGAAVEVTLKALYNYTADDDDELTFEEGDEIVKLSEPDGEGWTEGRLVRTGATGLFPIEYVDQGEAEA